MFLSALDGQERELRAADKPCDAASGAITRWTQDEGLCGEEGGCGETLWVSGEGLT